MNKVFKGGRCWNGFQLDAGIIVHYINAEEESGFWGGKSLCGTEPGRRGYGWALTTLEVNCPKCLKKINKLI